MEIGADFSVDQFGFQLIFLKSAFQHFLPMENNVNFPFEETVIQKLNLVDYSQHVIRALFTKSFVLR